MARDLVLQTRLSDVEHVVVSGPQFGAKSANERGWRRVGVLAPSQVLSLANCLRLR